MKFRKTVSFALFIVSMSLCLIACGHSVKGTDSASAQQSSKLPTPSASSIPAIETTARPSAVQATTEPISVDNVPQLTLNDIREANQITRVLQEKGSVKVTSVEIIDNTRGNEHINYFSLDQNGYARMDNVELYDDAVSYTTICRKNGIYAQYDVYRRYNESARPLVAIIPDSKYDWWIEHQWLVEMDGLMEVISMGIPAEIVTTLEDGFLVVRVTVEYSAQKNVYSYYLDPVTHLLDHKIFLGFTDGYATFGNEVQVTYGATFTTEYDASTVLDQQPQTCALSVTFNPGQPDEESIQCNLAQSLEYVSLITNTGYDIYLDADCTTKPEDAIAQFSLFVGADSATYYVNLTGTPDTMDTP